MHRLTRAVVAAVTALTLYPPTSGAEILAMLNDESKPDQPVRREGIAIIDVDPGSATFGKPLVDIPLPPDMVAHCFFDIGDGPKTPRSIKTIATAAGAHHVAFSPDERYAFVQNILLNLPGMSDGSITVIDLDKGAAIASIVTLKKQGLNPNGIVLLPEWHHDAGH